MPNLLHYFRKGSTTTFLCGETDDEEAAEWDPPVCLKCDRIIRDRVRDSNDLPPLSDAEFNEIHGRRRSKILVTKPDINGRL